MVRPNNEDRLYQAHADVCKVFANPWRLRIVEALGDSELTAGQLTAAVDIPKSNLSQHLATMRDKGDRGIASRGCPHLLPVGESENSRRLPVDAGGVAGLN